MTKRPLDARGTAGPVGKTDTHVYEASCEVWPISARRKLNEMFDIEFSGGKLELVKVSNGEPVPHDEPLFILRGRDIIALQALIKYYDACLASNVPQSRCDEVSKEIQRFRVYANEQRAKMKKPGITLGK